jgi:hypothetical protein
MSTPTAVAMPVLAFASMFQKQEEVGPPKSILLFGPPGTHKTSMLGALIRRPEFTKILIIDIDNGTEVFANFPDIHATIGDDFGQPGEKRINIIAIDKTDPNAYGMLRYLLGERNEHGEFIRGAVFGQGYDAIMVDTANVMQETAVQFLTSNVWNAKGQLDTQAAWGKVGEWTGDIAWAMQNDLTMTGFWAAHSKEGTEDGGSFKIKPKFQGGIKDNIGAIPSLVVYVEQGKKINVDDPETITATLGGSTIITSKNRYSFPGTIENFDMEKLYAMIAERLEGTRPGVTQPTSTPIEAPASVYI